MVAAVSDEFVTLCGTQISVLTQSLGATLSVVYLAEDWADETIANLRPIAAMPDSVMTWSAEKLLTWLTGGHRDNYPQALPSLPANSDRRLPSVVDAVPPVLDDDRSDRHHSAEQLQQPSHQLILPIARNSLVMGALVVARGEHPWSDAERRQAEDIAQTLAIACLLDQRSQWFSQELQHQRQLQRQQRDVLDDLLHQFRNPLTAMQTFGKLLLRKLMPDDRNRNAATSIVRESVRLQELLEEFSRAIEPEYPDTPPSLATTVEDADRSRSYVLLPSDEAEPSQVPLGSFLNGRDLNCQAHLITEILAPLLMNAGAIAQERQIEFNVELADGLPTVWVDAKALREVLNNLLDNALKYTPSGGWVWVWVGDRQPIADATQSPGTRQAIAIADNGPGIPTEDLTHVFERHYRGVQSQTNIPGTGLGLAIAQELIRLMHGRIEVFSPLSTWEPMRSAYPELAQRVTNGTVFVVWLLEATLSESCADP